MPSSQSAHTEHELFINIMARGRVEWIGTRAQLEAENVLPADIDWPTTWDGCESLTMGKFDYFLTPCPPKASKGCKGRKRLTPSDPCVLHARLVVRGMGGWDEAIAYAARRALETAAWNATPAHASRFKQARQDKAFQAVKRLLTKRPSDHGPRRVASGE